MPPHAHLDPQAVRAEAHSAVAGNLARPSVLRARTLKGNKPCHLRGAPGGLSPHGAGAARTAGGLQKLPCTGRGLSQGRPARRKAARSPEDRAAATTRAHSQTPQSAAQALAWVIHAKKQGLRVLTAVQPWMEWAREDKVGLSPEKKQRSPSTGKEGTAPGCGKPDEKHTELPPPAAGATMHTEHEGRWGCGP